MGPRPPVDALIAAIAERRPELARRLERLRREDPQRFHRVLMDAFMFRLEEALDRTEGPREGDRERRPPEARPSQEEPKGEVEELERANEELDARSRELAARLRALRRGETVAPLPDDSGSPEGVQRELERVVRRHFEVRTQLRQHELERIERELTELRRVVERMQDELHRRDAEREAIIQRRIDQLVGQDSHGW